LVVAFCGKSSKTVFDKHLCERALWLSLKRGLSSRKERTRGLEESMSEFIRRIWSEDTGQDIAEYAVMLAVILVLVVGTIRLIGSNANNAFSSVASSIQ
jgi:Flp pilus assembly pilin Flp